MYNEPLEQDEDEMSGGGLRSQLGRWWHQMRGRNEEDEEAYDDPVMSAPERAPMTTPRRDTFRVAAIKGSITVTQISNFGDTQKVADRLKGGEPQVVNLEETAPEVAERLIDFLNGVTYALDGYVEKVAEGGYLFTPAHIA